MSDPQYYRRKAEEMRDNAERFHDPPIAREFQRLADDFDRLADFTEGRGTGGGSRFGSPHDSAWSADEPQSVTASRARNRR